VSDFDFLHNSFNQKFELNNNGNELSPLEVVLVEDDQVLGKAIKKFLEKKIGVNVHYFLNPKDCLKEINFKVIDDNNAQKRFCLITDITFDEGGIDGLLLIDLLRERECIFESIAMTGFSSVETAVMASKKNVFKYLTKPFELDVLCSLVVKIFTSRFSVKEEQFPSMTSDNDTRIKESSYVFLDKFKIESPKKEDIFCEMIGRSSKMKEIFGKIIKVASSNSTILIAGDSGTGKELVANAIHMHSDRANFNMVSVNCGAIPSELLESELFGHVKGAFTGAISDRKGRFELANRGTIFLDEIGDMPLLLQVKLLRVLQTKSFEAVGGNKVIKTDTRIITATHRNLEKSVAEGNFREDLFYRLNVIPIKIPPLRDRKEDIPLLISYFLSKFVSADGRNNIEFNDQALELLLSYSWPGNVRELENLIERLVILRGGSVIRAEDLPAKIFETAPFYNQVQSTINLPEEGLDLRKTLSDLEDTLIIQALSRTGGNKNQASKLLQLNRTTLIEKMKKKNLLFV